MDGREHDSLSALLRRRIAADGGWWPFDRYMAAALYEPGLGYYARASRQFGTGPTSGSDFVTAPELSPLFGAALARQLGQVLDAAGGAEIVEFGAGSGALAEQLLDALLPQRPALRYRIVDLSGALRARQAARLGRFGDRVGWLDRWPDAIAGVVVGNEVLDAMPVKLLARADDGWRERGVAVAGAGFAWSDRPTALRPPLDPGYAPGSVVELHEQGPAFVRSLAERLQRGVAFFVDYGFPEAEYYHPQRGAGTLMCHRGHRAEPGESGALVDPGSQDITAHVDFTAIALAGQDAGLDVVGYTSQARFLLNCGILDLLDGAGARTLAPAQKLLAEHEMGELFKVIGFARGLPGFDAIGFAGGDRSHTL